MVIWVDQKVSRAVFSSLYGVGGVRASVQWATDEVASVDYR